MGRIAARLRPVCRRKRAGDGGARGGFPRRRARPIVLVDAASGASQSARRSRRSPARPALARLRARTGPSRPVPLKAWRRLLFSNSRAAAIGLTGTPIPPACQRCARRSPGVLRSPVVSRRIRRAFSSLRASRRASASRRAFFCSGHDRRLEAPARQARRWPSRRPAPKSSAWRWTPTGLFPMASRSAPRSSLPHAVASVSDRPCAFRRTA